MRAQQIVGFMLSVAMILLSIVSISHTNQLNRLRKERDLILEHLENVKKLDSLQYEYNSQRIDNLLHHLKLE